MKSKKNKNFSGIVICDSISMSLKKNRRDFRKPESVLIAIIGFVSVIMSFLDMFDTSYSTGAVIAAALIFSAVHIGTALSGKKSLWLAGGSFVLFAAVLFRFAEAVTDGFKYVYNIIYSVSHHTEISYYKLLDPDNEVYCTTVFYIFCIWLLAIVIYTFKISRTNPLVVMIFTFPIIEIGLYNGINIPVFWGILTVAYWFANASMFIVDAGEYYGGNGGFARRGDAFFPKRQMRFKVTEKCALGMIFTIAAAAAAALAVMNAVGYERSDSLNQKRVDIKEAVNSFSMDDFSSSISDLTEALGFTFSLESHKLGNVDHIKYKNVTDITATFDKKCDGAVYLKGYTGSVYGDNEWLELKNPVYKNSSDLFDYFSEFEIYPQDYPHIISERLFPDSSDITVWIEAKRKKNKSYAPYGTNNYSDMEYINDTLVSSKEGDESEYSYKFTAVDTEEIARYLETESIIGCTADDISDETLRQMISGFCEENGVDASEGFGFSTTLSMDSLRQCNATSDGELVLTFLLESNYRSFVYKNYLQVPENDDMDDVREAFADIIDSASETETAAEKLAVLDEIRERIASMADYTLSPGEAPSNRDFVSYFLLENHEGYCVHYATAGVILARMAGIPARYATGYVVVGDDFNEDTENSDGTYTINVQGNRSHAWAEVYLDGYGWVPFEFTEGYTSSSISNTEETESATDETTQSNTTETTSEAASESSESTQEITSAESSSESSTASVTTAASQTESTDEQNNGIGLGDGSGISRTNLAVLAAAAALILIVLLIYLWRCIIIKARRKRFAKGTNKSRVSAMYGYVEKLLAAVKIKRGGILYSDFAEYAERFLVPDYCGSGEFISFMGCALEGSFGGSDLSGEDVKKALEFTEELAENINKNIGFFRRLYLKIIPVLF